MSKTSLLIFAVAAALIGGSIYWAVSGDETQEPELATNPDTQNKNVKTIADNWQWKNFSDTEPAPRDGQTSQVDKPRSMDALPYDAVNVYKALQSIKLDENGYLVPDQTALQVLENGFLDMGPNLSQEAMSGLQDLIRKGLPGPAGEEAALILENYHRFRRAEIEFDAQSVNRLSAQEHHQRLVELRRNYLGQEVADQLFAVEDAQARHMFAAIAIEQNAGLKPEEKQAQQAALQDQLNNRLLAQGQLDPAEAAEEKVSRLREQGASSADIYSTRQAILGTEGARELAAADREEAQWQSRFNGFWQARRYVMQAGLDESERERQIEQLLNQYFGPEERERARVTSSEWQARDLR